jgi:hypothetical protein
VSAFIDCVKDTKAIIIALLECSHAYLVAACFGLLRLTRMSITLSALLTVLGMDMHPQTSGARSRR